MTPTTNQLKRIAALAVLLSCLLGPASVATASQSLPQVSAGAFLSCATKADATVICWGVSYSTTIPADLGRVKQIETGLYHACAVKLDDTVACWGLDDFGGTGVPNDLGAVKQLSAQHYIKCAVKADDTAACWTSRDISGGTAVPQGLGKVKQVSGGSTQACAVKVDDTVACWGDSIPYYGYALSDGSAMVPAGLGTVIMVSAGESHTCALKTAGTVACWGDNSGGQVSVPIGLTGVVSISAGGARSCALKSDHSVVCWGLQVNGINKAPDGLRAAQVSVGSGHSCAVKTSGGIVCWGNSGDGALNVPTAAFPALSNAIVNFGDTTGLDFGDVSGGHRSALLTLPIRSIGLVPGTSLTVSALAFTNSSNSLDAFVIPSENCTAAPIADGRDCVLRVRFTPEAWQRGDLTADITISDDSAAGTHVVHLTGRAVAPPSFSLENFQWLPATLGTGRFLWTPSHSAKVTITLTQPVTTVVTTKKGKKVTKKTVTSIKPVTLVANQASGLPTSDGVITTNPSFLWNGKVNRKPAAKGTWTATITAVSDRGKASLSQPVTVR